MGLIPNWQSSWRFATSIAGALLAAFDVLHTVMPSVQALVSPEAFATINIVVAAAIPILRVLQQQGGPVTPEVKQQLVDRALALPVKAPVP